MEVFAVSVSFLPAFALALLFLASAIALPPATEIEPDSSSAIDEQPLATHWIKELQLTPEQVEQLRTISDQYHDRLSQFEQELQQAERELSELMIGTVTTDKIQE